MGRTLGGGGNGAPKTRVTEFNKTPRQDERDAAQHGAGPQRELLGAVPGLHPRLLADHVDDADGAERRRGVQPLARGDGPVLRREPPQDRRRRTTRASTRTRSSRWRSRQPVFDDQGNWLPDEHGKTDRLRQRRVPAPRHEHGRLWRAQARQGHPELRRPGDAHHRRQLLPDERRRLGGAADEREEGAGAGPGAAGAHHRHGRRRREAAGDGPRPDPVDEEGAAPRRHRRATRSTASSSTRRSRRR